MAHAAEFRRLRAPQEDGQTLVEPPARSLPHVVAKNRRQLGTVQYDVQGRSLADLAACARRSLLDQAVAHTANYRNVSEATRRRRDSLVNTPLILSGHQPQLFHPGVWYKNFVLGRLAREVAGVGIHLLIDSDLCRSVSIRVPTGSADQPRVETVAYDLLRMQIPYEERVVCDEARFASFSTRVSQLLRPLVCEPIVETLWPLCLQPRDRESNLGLRLAQGRHALEAAWKNDTLELPMSRVCQLPEFSWFVAHLLAHLPRFWAAHNDALAAYRQAHRLRNRAHPVPDLVESGGWLESPFWIWTGEDPRRRALFARSRGDVLEITDRKTLTTVLPLADDADATPAVEQLVDLAGRGVKLRTRALTTTLFARLFLSDMFLHGIGGAKYDQVTDLIGQQFFGCELPEFATVSATSRLPIDGARTSGARQRDVQRQLRELRYHPERYVVGDGVAPKSEVSGVVEIVAAKRRWIETPKTLSNSYERHVAITGANEALQPFVLPHHQKLEVERRRLQQQQRVEAILDSREYSFCLFPRQHLERLLLDAAAPAS